jgi:glycosyltransferase involved in cell wall biosynthesis
VLTAVAADPAAREIIVVIDGHADGSLEYIQELAVADPRFRPMWQENTGEGVARQRGAIAATSEVVMFMDDDVVAGPNLVGGHAAHHAEADNLVVVGYMPTRRPPKTGRTPDSFTTDLYADEYLRTCDLYRAQPDRILRNLWAGNISMRRENVLRVPHSTDYRLPFHEDQDFGLRAHQAGLRGVFDETLASEHVHKRGRDSFIRQAYASGTARRFLDDMYSDFELGLDPAVGLPAPIGAVVKIAAKPVGTPFRKLLNGVSNTSNKVGWFGGATAADRLLRQVELYRGYHEPVPALATN